MTEMQDSDIYFAIYKISVVLIKDLKCQSELWISLKVYSLFRLYENPVTVYYTHLNYILKSQKQPQEIQLPGAIWLTCMIQYHIRKSYPSPGVFNF